MSSAAYRGRRWAVALLAAAALVAGSAAHAEEPAPGEPAPALTIPAPDARAGTPPPAAEAMPQAEWPDAPDRDQAPAPTPAKPHQRHKPAAAGAPASTSSEPAAAAETPPPETPAPVAAEPPKPHHRRKPPELTPPPAPAAEAAPVEAKPVEAKPVEAKPVEAAPAEAKPPEAAPAEAKPPTPPPVPSAAAGQPWNDTVMLDRLCGPGLRPNEEDRLFGMISLTARTTMRYENGLVAEDLLGAAAEDALSALLAACPQLAKTDEAHRLGVAIDIIRDTTEKRLAQGGSKPRHAFRIPARATAADLSEELTSHEIDAWLDGMPPRQRALTLFLYASDVTPKEVAAALGVPAAALNRGIARTRSRMLSYFRDSEDGATALSKPRADRGPPMQYTAAASSIAGLMQPGTQPETEAAPLTIAITGISSDLYAGWTLLATVGGLARDRTLDVAAPFLVESEGGHRRLVVTAGAEITRPDEPVRRFLLKAYTIDGDSGGVGLHDTLKFAAAAVDNKEALKTLANPNLSSIEIARCLWHDYGKADDPGLCR